MKKKNICLYLQVHTPAYLRRYHFFDMGNRHNYFDDFATRNSMQQMAEECYLPTNELLYNMICKHGKDFKVSISITGQLIELMEQHVPEVLDSFKKLANTGCVEFLAETYSHSLAFLRDETEFKEQVKKHVSVIKKHFGKKPTAMRLTGLIYSDQIGEKVAEMGFKTMLTENARHIMAWKSPNFVYSNNNNKNLKLLLRNSEISNKISFHFSDESASYWPITCEKVVDWMDAIEEKDEVINLFMDYSVFGFRHKKNSGIFDFFAYLPEKLLETGRYTFSTVSETSKKYEAIDALEVPYPISWYEDECDLSVWLGNNMQQDAFDSLCGLGVKIRFIDNNDITCDWRRLQDSNHFYFMSTRWQADRLWKRLLNPYDSAYDAYINYMNILNDLTMRVEDEVGRKITSLMKNKEFAEKTLNQLFIATGTIRYSPEQIDKIIELTNA